ncbi:unnamed protein product [Rotaria sp. Silwood2]|nr:unnamed protein product [Rotaria sp. Silwood2]CAF2587627.1 unnamed protein product [Rotaria sp. Silwood2]CAF2837041.1 unnamed protein product [Rotaria sp. Silwood2]CAF3429833.1 unnamed protein product [Rotaria sp. Silwood2]CAF4012781.1 unnamed protein product [Rotaria sp. Silwood2]
MASSSSSAERLKGVLSVTVLQAKNLVKSEWFGENDCYAVISIEPIPMKNTNHGNEKKQTDTYQRTQIHYGCNPIFNERFLFPVPQKLDALYVQIWDADYDKDDLLAHGTLSLLDDEQGGRYDTNLDKAWLHTVSFPMLNEKGGDGGTLELVLHFIPETTAAYMGKKFDVAQAEVKKKITQHVVAKVTDVASEKIRAFVGIGV